MGITKEFVTLLAEEQVVVSYEKNNPRVYLV